MCFINPKIAKWNEYKLFYKSENGMKNKDVKNFFFAIYYNAHFAIAI